MSQDNNFWAGLALGSLTAKSSKGGGSDSFWVLVGAGVLMVVAAFAWMYLPYVAAVVLALAAYFSAKARRWLLIGMGIVVLALICIMAFAFFDGGGLKAIL